MVVLRPDPAAPVPPQQQPHVQPLYAAVMARLRWGLGRGWGEGRGKDPPHGLGRW